MKSKTYTFRQNGILSWFKPMFQLNIDSEMEVESARKIKSNDGMYIEIKFKSKIPYIRLVKLVTLDILVNDNARQTPFLLIFPCEVYPFPLFRIGKKSAYWSVSFFERKDRVLYIKFVRKNGKRLI